MDVSTLTPSVVTSSSTTGGASVVGRLKRFTLEVAGRKPLDDGNDDRATGRLELKVPGRRIGRPDTLDRTEDTIGETRLEKRLLVLPDDRTGVGLIENSEETRERKSPRDPSTEVLDAPTDGDKLDAADERNRLLNDRVDDVDGVDETGATLLDATTGSSTSAPGALPVKGGRRGLVRNGGRGRWANGRMLGVKVRLRGGATRRVVILPPLPSVFEASSSTSELSFSLAGAALDAVDASTSTLDGDACTMDPSSSID